jgi:hypothetical protein
MSDKLSPLSASKIKTLQSCSWTYWSKYHLKLPDDSNDGASRGTICHAVFECLGNPRHKPHYKAIHKHQSAWKSKAVKRLVKITAKKLGVLDKENLQLINEMIVNGVNYDFFGKDKENPSEGISEKDFNIVVEEGEKKYSIRGFIDKLFLYKKSGTALIRDFKTSKKVFSGKDRTDNLQDLMYSLAVKKLYPKFLSRRSEFLFLKFNLEEDLLGEKGEGVVLMDEISDDELEGFEYFLTEIQSVIQAFSEDDAVTNFAAKQNYPKDGSFGGPLSCGFAKKPGQLKKDGTKMWHCSFKFPYSYWKLTNKDGDIIKTSKNKEDLEKISSEGDEVQKMFYEGCPHWNSFI